MLLLAAALTAPALGYFEPHLGEMTAPVADAVRARVAELDGLPSLDRAQRRERTSLNRLLRTLDRASVRLSKDVAKLAAAATAVKRLREAGEPFADEVQECLERAKIVFNEREDLLGDHLALLTSGRERDRVERKGDRAAAARDKAEAAATPDAQARLLKKAERLLSSTLRLAERTVLKKGETPPPTRVRSGDSVGAAGARVVVPRGSGLPLEGVSVVLAPGAFTVPTAVTIEPGTSFVGGRDVPAGPAVTVLPSGVALEADATLYLPYLLPDGSSALDLAVFRDDGDDGAPVPGRTLESEAVVSAKVLQLGTFQAGVQAPPVGAPDGRYVVHGFTVIGPAGTTTTDPVVFDPNFSAGILGQDFVFRRDGSGTALTGSVSVVNRAYTATTPHHFDSSSFAPSSFDFAWTQDGANRFSFTFPVPPADTATVRGVASTAGDVIVFTARGGIVDFVAVGVRAGSGVAAADLDGRWAAVSQGVVLLDGAAEPFRTRWTCASRTFDVASGTLTFDGAGQVFRSDLTYSTQLADPAHAASQDTASDGGTLTLTVFSDGTVQDGTGAVRGIFSPPSGLLVLARLDATNKVAELTLAAKQPDAVPSSMFEGDWQLARFETGITAGAPDARSSTQEFLGRLGTLAVAGTLDAAEDFDAGTRGVLALNGAAPVSSMKWTQTRATSTATAASRMFVLSPDAAGNDRGAMNPVWWSVSGDGGILLGAVTGTDARLSTGIVVGVR